jgi:hypothetical protein
MSFICEGIAYNVYLLCHSIHYQLVRAVRAQYGAILQSSAFYCGCRWLTVIVTSLVLLIVYSRSSFVHLDLSCWWPSASLPYYNAIFLISLYYQGAVYYLSCPFFLNELARSLILLMCGIVFVFMLPQLWNFTAKFAGYMVQVGKYSDQDPRSLPS